MYVVCLSVIWIKCVRLCVFRVLNAIRAESGHTTPRHATPEQWNKQTEALSSEHMKSTHSECVMGQIKTWHVNNLSSRYAVLPLLLLLSLPLCDVIVCGFCGDKSPEKIQFTHTKRGKRYARRVDSWSRAHACLSYINSRTHAHGRRTKKKMNSLGLEFQW